MNTRTRAVLATTVGTVLLAVSAAPAYAAEVPEVTMVEAPQADVLLGSFSTTAEVYDELFGACETLSTYSAEAHGWQDPYADFLTSPGGEVIPDYHMDQASATSITVRIGPTQAGHVLVANPEPSNMQDDWYLEGAQVEFYGGWVAEEDIVERESIGDSLEDYAWCGSIAEQAAALRPAEPTEGSVTESPSPGVTSSGPAESPGPTMPEDPSSASAAVPISIGVAVVAVLVAAWAVLSRRKRPTQD